MTRRRRIHATPLFCGLALLGIAAGCATQRGAADDRTVNTRVWNRRRRNGSASDQILRLSKIWSSWTVPVCHVAELQGLAVSAASASALVLVAEPSAHSSSNSVRVPAMRTLASADGAASPRFPSSAFSCSTLASSAYGARRDEMRRIFDTEGDWGRLLAMFAAAVTGEG